MIDNKILYALKIMSCINVHHQNTFLNVYLLKSAKQTFPNPTQFYKLTITIATKTLKIHKINILGLAELGFPSNSDFYVPCI